jgi:hypothetical protein
MIWELKPSSAPFRRPFRPHLGPEYLPICPGNGGDDVIRGGDGPDTVDDGDGHDWIDGGASPDDLSGGNGNDVL